MTELSAPTIAVLPIGELDQAATRDEFEAKLAVLRRMSAELLLNDPVSDEPAARQVVERWADQRPDLLLIVGLRGLSAEAQEAAARALAVPCLLWPTQGRYALPSSALAAGALRESRADVELLDGPPDDPLTLARLRRFIRAARAYARLRRSRIGLIGGLFPNLVACRYDTEIVQARLGVRLIPLDYADVRAAMHAAASRPDEIAAARQALADAYAIAAVDAPALSSGLSLHQALKQIARDQNLDAFATECWSGLPRALGLNPCLGLTEDAYGIACEGDVMACCALLLTRYLTGVSAYVGDLYTLDLAGKLTLIHCGGPASLAADQHDTFVGRSALGLERGFETVTCRPQLPAGPVTLLRFYGHNCDHMHLAAGTLLDCQQSPNLGVNVQLGGDRWDFLDHCLGNHYLVVPGDLRPELALWCRWQGVELHET